MNTMMMMILQRIPNTLSSSPLTFFEDDKVQANKTLLVRVKDEGLKEGSYLAPPPPFWCNCDWMWDFLFQKHNTNTFRSTNEITILRDSPGKMWNTNFPPTEFFMTIPKALKFFCFLSSPLSYEILQGARMELYSTVQTMSSTTDRYNWIHPTLRRMEQMCQMKQLSSMRNVAPLASAPLTRICSRRLGLAHTVLRCLGTSYETTRPCTSFSRRVTFCWFLSVTHGEGVLNQQKLVNEF